MMNQNKNPTAIQLAFRKAVEESTKKDKELIRIALFDTKCQPDTVTKAIKNNES